MNLIIHQNVKIGPILLKGELLEVHLKSASLLMPNTKIKTYLSFNDLKITLNK